MQDFNNTSKMVPIRSKSGKEYVFYEDTDVNTDEKLTDGSELGIVNKNFKSVYKPRRIGLTNLGTPEEIEIELAKVGYFCMPFYAAQLALVLNNPTPSIRTLMLEGPSGCGKSFLAKSLAKITGAEFMCLSCFKGMNLDHLIEKPSQMAVLHQMSGRENVTDEELMQLGIISRAFQKSQEKPVILLIDELDKVDIAIDTFFLGPIQDAKIYLQSRPPIEANVDNLLLIFTKNFERTLNDALLRRIHPIRMDFMDCSLERKVLSQHCRHELVENLIRIAEIMRNRNGAYPFERPPAPEELLRAGIYITSMIEWELIDFSFVGENIFYTLAKSDHDRRIFELMLRYHPDFQDPLVPDNRNATIKQIYARLGKDLLTGIVEDIDAKRRAKAYKPEKIGLTNVGEPEELARRLSDVGYQALPFVAAQVSLLLNTKTEKVRAILMEGPSGCGKSFFAKCLAKITGAELMCTSCYAGMDTSHLIEVPSAIAMATRAADMDETPKEKLMNLGILSKAFLKSQSQPTILLIDELDKVESSIDTFFLGPVQDGRIYLESRPPIDADLDNLLLIFTKNFNRVLDQALLRRLHPIRMNYLDSSLERRVLSKECMPQLVSNLVSIAERMRDSLGAYQFERPPAPEELGTAAHFIMKLLEWNHNDFAWIGKNIWNILAKSEHDRAVLEHMLRYHPDFMDPLVPDSKNASIEVINARLGRIVMDKILDDPDKERREEAWRKMQYGI